MCNTFAYLITYPSCSLRQPAGMLLFKTHSALQTILDLLTPLLEIEDLTGHASSTLAALIRYHEDCCTVHGKTFLHQSQKYCHTMLFVAQLYLAIVGIGSNIQYCSPLQCSTCTPEFSCEVPPHSPGPPPLSDRTPPFSCD